MSTLRAMSAARIQRLQSLSTFVKAERASATSRASLQDPHNASVAQLLGGRISNYASVRASVGVTEAVKKMNGKKIGALLVLEDRHPTDGGHGNFPRNSPGCPHAALKGIITERDVLCAVPMLVESARELTVADIMSPNPTTVSADTTMGECMDLMIQHGFRHLPVLDNDDLVGVLSIRDIVEKLNKDHKDLVVDLNIQLSRLSALSGSVDDTPEPTTASRWWR